MFKKVNEFFFEEDSYWTLSDKICMTLLIVVVAFAAYAMYVGRFS